MDENNCIGVGNDLPWRISADLKRFKVMTTGKPMIMGRKTFDSFGGKPLPNRLHIVISRNPHPDADKVVYVPSFDDALRRAEEENPDEIMVLGGGQIFALTLDKADRLYMTEVHTKVPRCDASFPLIADRDWHLIEEDGPHEDEKTGLRYTYKTYDRRRA